MTDAQILPHVLHHLALDEADLRARVADLESDNVTLREMLQAALDVLHDLQVEHKRMEARYHQTLNDNRQLRADLRTCQLGRAA